MVKTRGNDATPTWSGFNYQGKITLLSALIEINILLKDDLSLNQSYIEIEKTEDFIIYINNKVVSLNQVKAYLSATKVSSFNEAMQKLITHRAEKGELCAKCVLCCPLEISDWNDSANTFNNQVSLFKYSNTHVHVTDVPKYIKQELTQTLNALNLSTSLVEELYLGLCELLNTKISDMHAQGTNNRNYNLCFTDIAEFLSQSHNGYIAKAEAKTREKVYEYICNNFNAIIDNYCSQNCFDKKNNACRLDISGTCSIKTAYDYMLNINIWEYTKYLYPNIIDKWEDPFTYVKLLNDTAIENLLVPVLHRIHNNMLQSSNNSIYCDTDVYKTIQSKVIPTLLSFQSSKFATDDDIGNSISSKLENIKKNTYLASSIVAGSTITADTDNKVYSTNDDCIFYFSNNEQSDSIISNTQSGVKIVDSQDFIERIK